MFLEGDNWAASCANAYSDNVTLFSLAVHKITGFVPIYIEGGNLPAERADIWGDMLTHTEQPKRRSIPIKVVNDQQEMDGVRVYTKSSAMEAADGLA
jgi:hypothetical protein